MAHPPLAPGSPIPDRPRLTLLTGHGAPVVCAVFSPDGATLATGSYDRTVILWDVESGGMLRRLEGHADSVTSLAFSPDGRLLFSAGYDGVSRWDVETGRWRGAFPNLSGPAAFVGPGTLLAEAAEHFVRIEADSGAELRRVPLGTERDDSFVLRTATAVSPDASLAALAVYDDAPYLSVLDLRTGGTVFRRRVPRMLWWKVRDPETGRLRTTHGAAAGAEVLALSPDGRRLAVGDSLTLWLAGTRTGKRTHLLLCGRDGAHSLAFSPDSRTLAAGTRGGSLVLWRLPSGEIMHSLQAHDGWASAVAFSPDGALVATGSHDNTVKIWRADTGECRRQFPGARHAALSVAFTPDGEFLVSGHGDGTVRCWDASTGALRQTLACRRVQFGALYITPDARTVASAAWQPGEMGAATTVEPRRLRDATTEPLPETGCGALHVVEISPPLGLLFSMKTRGEGDALAAWEIASGERRYELEGRIAAICPDGLLLAVSSGWQGRLCLRDASSGELIREFAPPQVADWIDALRFSPDGRTLLAGFGGFGIGLWEVETGRLLWETRTHADAITAVDFAPDGGQIAVAGAYDETVVLWDLTSRRERLMLKGHQNSLRGLAFSPDGEKLATASADGTVKLWDPHAGGLLATLVLLPAEAGAASKEWLAHAPEGYYHGSPGAERFIRWQVGAALLASDVHRDRYRRPERVAEALSPTMAGADRSDACGD